MERAILKNSKRFRMLPCLAGFTLLAGLFSLISSHARSGTPDNTTGTETPTWVRTKIARLQSTNATERTAAILRLRHRRATAAIPALIHLLGSDAEFPRMALLVSSFAPLTRSCSPACTVGGEAAETLARIGQTPDDWLALLKSRDSRTRANTIRALGGMKERVQINAAGALGRIKASAAVEPLIGLLANEESAARAAAAAALGELGDPRAREPLVAMVRHEDRWEITMLRGLQALAQLGHNGAVTALREYERHRPDWKEWWSSNKELLLK